MDRSKAKGILEVYGNPVIETEGGTIEFARQKEGDIREIESMDNENLIEDWKSLVYLVDIVGQVSLSDMQRINLLELEMSERDIDEDELANWYREAKAKEN